MKKHIFAAKHGEGKTKWLINKAFESQKNGKDIVYVGTTLGYYQFVDKCSSLGINKIYYVNDYSNFDCYESEFDLFTDELLYELLASNFKLFKLCDILYMSNSDTQWYITMGSEDFVNG